MQNSPLTRFEPATTLEEIHLTLSPKPLTTQKEINAFYRPEMNEVRGGDKVKRLKLGLERVLEAQEYYKACVMGHPGVGKSTELTRLINDAGVNQKFRAIRFSILSDLDPLNFNPLDVVLLMLVEIVEQTAKIAERPSNKNLQNLWSWYNKEEVAYKETKESKVTTEAGSGIKGGSLWAQMLGLFASLKGELRFASTREKKIVEYRISRFNDLIAIANELLDECNKNLQKKENHQWLMLGEDFDKAGISTAAIEDLFVTYANIFKDLKLHLIFNVPIALYNSCAGILLTFPFERSLIIPDTTVFYQNHSPNVAGRNALRKVLEARVNSNLFEQGQIERLIVASGGNIRDLFSLINYASDTASIDDRNLINIDDVTVAIGNLRTEYERRLGENPFDKDQIVYDDKATLLKRIYDGDEKAQIPNEVLYVLLYNRAIQELDEGEGKRCFGVHPLVVDILNSQNIIPFSSQGGVPGGTSST
jgi:hypothetical protein